VQGRESGMFKKIELAYCDKQFFATREDSLHRWGQHFNAVLNIFSEFSKEVKSFLYCTCIVGWLVHPQD